MHARPAPPPSPSPQCGRKGGRADRAKMADPLTLLRKYVTSGRLDDVVVSGDRVEFGSEYSFKRNAKTAFKSKVKDRGFYDLDALLHLAKAMGAADYSRASYVSGTRAANVAAVAFPDTQVQRRGHPPACAPDSAPTPPARPSARPPPHTPALGAVQDLEPYLLGKVDTCEQIQPLELPDFEVRPAPPSPRCRRHLAEPAAAQAPTGRRP